MDTKKVITLLKTNLEKNHLSGWLVIAVVLLGSFSVIGLKFQQFNQTIAELESLSASVHNSISQNQGSDQSVASMHQKNKELIDTAKLFKQATEEEKSTILNNLIQLAQERKNAILTLAEDNPGEAISLAINPLITNQLPNEVKPFIETKKQIKGELEYLIIENPEEEIFDEEFFITETSTNTRYKLHPTGQVQALTGDSLSIDGYVIDEQIIAHSKDIKKSGNIFKNVPRALQTASAHNATSNTKKVLVILMNWQDDQRTPFTVEEVRGLYFTNPDSARNFYLENTSNAISLVGKNNGVNGDVYGWVTIPNTSTNCNYNNWATAAKNAVQATGVSTSGYDLISYVLPFNSNCSWGGIAQLGGQNSWINIATIGNNLKRTIPHELGHNLGRHHAGSIHCTLNGEDVSIGGTCSLSEYGDIFDVMGSSSGPKHMNVFNKGRTGNGVSTWLPSSAKLTVNRSTSPDATYTIVPQASNLPGIKALRIPVSTSNSSDQYYYIELRQNIGLDVFTSGTQEAVTQGLSIRLGPDYGVQGKSYLIDTNPNSADPNFPHHSYEIGDSSLKPGQTFTDPNTGIHIQTLSVSETGAEVRVFFSSPSCTNTSPSVSINPSNQSTVAGGTLTYQITVQNTDSTTNCSGSSYTITPNLPTGFIQSPESIITPIIGPGQSQSFLVNITSPDTATGTNSWSQTVTHTEQSGVTTTANAMFTIAGADTTPPSITILSPSNGSNVPNKGVTINATAGDTSGISQVQIIQNGQIIKTCTDTTNSTLPVNCSIKRGASNFSTGPNTIIVTAQDKSFNQNTASQTIIVTR